MSKKVCVLFGGMILMVAVMANLNVSQPSAKNIDLRLANIEALAQNESSTDCSSPGVCPNGGQPTKGSPTPKDKTETLTADMNGTITVNGQPFQAGASFANKKCKVVIGWIECDYKKAPNLDCCMCNHYVIAVGGA